MVASPELLTERLRIVPFEVRHLSERYVGWLNDLDVTRFSEQRFRTHTLDSCRQYWESFQSSPHYFWAIEECILGLGHIGNMNAYIDERNGLADAGILIGESAARGKGYGLEAWQAVCRWLLREGNLRKITAGTLSVNIPMLKVMERSGMVQDGVRHRHQLFEHAAVDVIHMALFREQLDSTAHTLESVRKA